MLSEVYVGVVLAGGTGSRLRPLTFGINKHFIPIFDKPMIYYPLSVLMMVGIREIILVCDEKDENNYRRLLGDGSTFGINLRYVIQPEPKGIGDAISASSKWIQGRKTCVILGDNLFYGNSLLKLLEGSLGSGGCSIFCQKVKDPSGFGVVVIGADGVISIREKPQDFVSNLAITGLYFFDEDLVEIVSLSSPSERGELEITSILAEYLRRGKLKIAHFGRGVAWFDTGTYDGIEEASSFVRAIQSRQGIYIGCLEEISYNNGWMTDRDLLERWKLVGGDYAEYIKALID